MGRNRLVSRNERTRIDQNGQRIRPKKKIEIRKTRMKYFPLSVFGDCDGGVARLSGVFIESSRVAENRNWVAILIRAKVFSALATLWKCLENDAILTG
jgi:hypothetical protein